MVILPLSHQSTPRSLQKNEQLSDPDAESPLNCDAGNMIRGGDQIAFYTTAAMYTVENAMFTHWPPIQDDDDDDDDAK